MPSGSTTSTIYASGLQYHTLLLFHDHTFWDLKDDNAWEMYGTYKPTTATGALADHLYIRRDNITHEIPFLASRCDLEKGRFDGSEGIYSTNNCFSSVAPGGYLYHRNPISITNEFSSLACWFKIRSNDANEFYGSDKYHITLCDWINEKNTRIHIEIRARDDAEPLIECIKVCYTYSDGTKRWFQFSYIEPFLNDTWYYFTYAMNTETEQFYINGTVVLSVSRARKATDPMIYKEIKIGAHDTWCSGGLNIDEFVIMNDYLPDIIKGTPDKPLFWIKPEMLRIQDLSEEKNIYYQLCSTLRLDFILNSPASVLAPDSLEFDGAEGTPIAVFKGNIKLPDTDWTGDVRKITLLRAVDIADIYTAKFVLVTLVKFIPDNTHLKINGTSLYDYIIHPIRITRISYWQEPEDGLTNMINKYRWYQDNKVPMSDFRYVDKFHPEYKQFF